MLAPHEFDTLPLPTRREALDLLAEHAAGLLQAGRVGDVLALCDTALGMLDASTETGTGIAARMASLFTRLRGTPPPAPVLSVRFRLLRGEALWRTRRLHDARACFEEAAQWAERHLREAAAEAGAERTPWQAVLRWRAAEAPDLQSLLAAARLGIARVDLAQGRRREALTAAGEAAGLLERLGGPGILLAEACYLCALLSVGDVLRDAGAPPDRGGIAPPAILTEASRAALRQGVTRAEQGLRALEEDELPSPLATDPRSQRHALWRLLVDLWSALEPAAAIPA